MKIDRPTVVIACILIALMMMPFIYLWDSNTNRGFTFGYYGQFNTVSNAISKFKGIAIVWAWHNTDVTLEEFGFDAKTPDGRLLKIYFGERDAIRTMGGSKLEAALAKRIEEVMATQTNNPSELSPQELHRELEPQ
jgi:hypothetical protein